MEINQPSTQEWDRTLLEGLPILKQCRWPKAVMLNRARPSGGSRRVGHEFREYTRIRNRKDSLFRVDSRSVFFGHIDFTGYIDFADTAEFKGKQKVPHSYSRALKKTRASLNGVRDDGTN
jgi:hypothetical protein